MPFEKGESGNPSGRPKGSRNRSTCEMRKVLAIFIDANIDCMSKWLEDIAKDDPKSAFQCMLSLMEFSIPRISRVHYVEEKEETPKDNEDIDDFLRSIAIALKKNGG